MKRSFAIATVLDPRYKLYVYDTTQDPVELKASAKLAVELAFERYSSIMPAVTPVSIEPSVPATKKRRIIETGLSGKTELGIYLAEDVMDIESSQLDYWRANKTRFPILARMARDYLPLQPTSKDVEGNFSKGRRTIPYNRRRQKASTIRNQMLANSGYNLGVFA